MKKLNKKQIVIIAAALVFFTCAAFFVYLKQLKIEMTAEAGIVAGEIIKREQAYYAAYGEYAALEELSKSEALQLSLEGNKYFTSMRIDVIGDTFELYSFCRKGFFKGAQVYAKYNAREGMTQYDIKQGGG